MHLEFLKTRVSPIIPKTNIPEVTISKMAQLNIRYHQEGNIKKIYLTFLI